MSTRACDLASVHLAMSSDHQRQHTGQCDVDGNPAMFQEPHDLGKQYRPDHHERWGGRGRWGALHDASSAAPWCVGRFPLFGDDCRRSMRRPSADPFSQISRIPFHKYLGSLFTNISDPFSQISQTHADGERRQLAPVSTRPTRPFRCYPRMSEPALGVRCRACSV